MAGTTNSERSDRVLLEFRELYNVRPRNALAERGNLSDLRKHGGSLSGEATSVGMQAEAPDWMIANRENGVSPCEIHRSLCVTRKTAGFMLRELGWRYRGLAANSVTYRCEGPQSTRNMQACCGCH